MARRTRRRGAWCVAPGRSGGAVVGARRAPGSTARGTPRRSARRAPAARAGPSVRERRWGILTGLRAPRHGIAVLPARVRGWCRRDAVGSALLAGGRPGGVGVAASARGAPTADAPDAD